MSAVYRVVVTSWPTPDGRPFRDQTPEFWDDIVEGYCNPSDDAVYPEWLPDIGDCLSDETDYGTQEPAKVGRYIRNDKGHLIIVVPDLRRTTYFMRHVAQQRVDELAEWGVTVHLETAELGPWTPAASNQGAHDELS